MTFAEAFFPHYEEMDPRELLRKLEKQYFAETECAPPLVVSLVRNPTDAELEKWMAWLRQRFPGFVSDGCTAVPSLAAKAACQWHDLLYFLGCNRRLADLELLYWMQRMRYMGPWWLWLLNTAWSRIYYAGVRLFGGWAYEKHRLAGHPSRASG